MKRIATTGACTTPTHLALVSLLVLGFALPAAAQTVVFDQGPTTGTTAGCWTNESVGHNFADKATLTASYRITAIDIFTCHTPVVTTVHIKILADNGSGLPGSVLYAEDTTPDSWVADAASSGYKVRVLLTTPFVTQAGVTYWYGVSGNELNVDQWAVATPGDGQMAQFLGSAYSSMATVGDQMFQLEGEVPEIIPALGGWGLAALVLLVGVAGLAVLRRAA